MMFPARQLAEQSLRFKSFSELESRLMPRLRNRVFHVTTPEGYEGIRRDGRITSNVDGKFPMTCSQSEMSYFRKKGCVSLIDLRNASEAELADGLCKYYFLHPFTSNRSVFLILKPTCDPDLISWEISKEDEGLRAMIVPYIEAGYSNFIPIDLIESVIITERE
jgi:hypothetical protein